MQTLREKLGGESSALAGALKAQVKDFALSNAFAQTKDKQENEVTRPSYKAVTD